MDNCVPIYMNILQCYWVSVIKILQLYVGIKNLNKEKNN